MRTTILVLGFMVCISGCGGSGATIQDNPDLTDLNNLVGMAGSTDGEGWEALFVEGAAPADKTPYTDPIFALPAVPKVNISGDTAEIEVLMLTAGPDTDGDGVPDEIETTLTWTAQKVGDVWKLKSAPLP